MAEREFSFVCLYNSVAWFLYNNTGELQGGFGDSFWTVETLKHPPDSDAL
jgi:hypothetical protein